MTTDNKGAMTDEHCINCGLKVDPKCACSRGRALFAAQPAQVVGVTPVAWMGDANGHEDVVIKSVTKPYNMENAKPLGVIAPVPAAPLSFDGLTEQVADEIARHTSDVPGTHEAVRRALAACDAEISPRAAPEPIPVPADDLPGDVNMGVSELLNVIECLRDTGEYYDGEGEATDRLEALAKFVDPIRPRWTQAQIDKCHSEAKKLAARFRATPEPIPATDAVKTTGLQFAKYAAFDDAGRLADEEMTAFHRFSRVQAEGVKEEQHVPHTRGGFEGSFYYFNKRKPTAQEYFDAGMRAGRDIWGKGVMYGLAPHDAGRPKESMERLTREFAHRPQIIQQVADVLATHTAPAVDAVPVHAATVAWVDDSGPCLEWVKHWVDLVGAKLYYLLTAAKGK